MIEKINIHYTILKFLWLNPAKTKTEFMLRYLLIKIYDKILDS